MGDIDQTDHLEYMSSLVAIKRHFIRLIKINYFLSFINGKLLFCQWAVDLLKGKM
jgi:hypothetical protein